MITQLRKKCLRPSHNRNKGFTILELLIVIGIVSIIGVVVYSFFTNITQKSTNERIASQIQQKARLAIDVITRDLRMMGLDPTNGVASDVFAPSTFNCPPGSVGQPASSSQINATQIFINADLDYNGNVNSDFEQIGYWYDDVNETVNIMFKAQGITDAAQTTFCEPLVDNVTDFELIYRDANNTDITAAVIADPDNQVSNIYFITVSITIRETKVGAVKESGDDAFMTRTYTETVRLRNRP